MRTIDTSTKLTDLWLFIPLTTIFRDIHQLAMTPVQGCKGSRPMTVIAAGIATAALVSLSPTDAVDMSLPVIKLVAMVAISWTSWKPPEDDRTAA